MALAYHLPLEKKKENMCEKWTDSEVQALLAFFGTEEIQRGFTGSRRNETIYRDISAHLSSLGIHHTAKRCREKIKKLKQTYKKLKDYNNRTGSDIKINKWYGQLDAILGHRPTAAKGSVPLSQQTRTANLYETVKEERDQPLSAGNNSMLHPSYCQCPLC